MAVRARFARSPPRTAACIAASRRRPPNGYSTNVFEAREISRRCTVRSGAAIARRAGNVGSTCDSARACGGGVLQRESAGIQCRELRGVLAECLFGHSVGGDAKHRLRCGNKHSARPAGGRLIRDRSGIQSNASAGSRRRLIYPQYTATGTPAANRSQSTASMWRDTGDEWTGITNDLSSAYFASRCRRRSWRRCYSGHRLPSSQAFRSAMTMVFAPRMNTRDRAIWK